MNPNNFYISNINNPFNPQLIKTNITNFKGINPLYNFNNLFKSFNIKGLITNINKSLNIINQTIPIIKEAKPTINNLKSIIKLTKVFNKETSNIKMPKNNIYYQERKDKHINNNNYPTFFI